MFRHPKRYCLNKRCFPDLIYVGRVFLNRTASAWYFSVPPFAPTRLVCCCHRRPWYFSTVGDTCFLTSVFCLKYGLSYAVNKRSLSPLQARGQSYLKIFNNYASSRRYYGPPIDIETRGTLSRSMVVWCYRRWCRSRSPVILFLRSVLCGAVSERGGGRKLCMYIIVCLRDTFFAKIC